MSQIGDKLKRVEQLADRVPPSDLDSEIGVLGSVLLDNRTLHEVRGIIDTKHFYSDANGKLWDAILSMADSGTPIDPVTLSDELHRRKILGDIGGNRYLGTILDKVPHPGHAVYYAETVHEKWQRREAIYSLLDGVRNAYESYDWPDSLEKIDRRVQVLIENRIKTRSGTLQDAVSETLDDLQATTAPGIPTGFHGLDQLLSGLQPCSLIVLAARPSVGKTSLALNISENIARWSGVLFFSLEQSRHELIKRMLAGRLQCSSQALRQMANGSDEEREALLDASGDINRLKLFIEDEPGRTVSEMLSITRLHQRKQELSLIVVDYLSLVTPDDRRAMRESQVAQMSRDLKKLAKTTGLPLLLLCQLNRESEKRENPRPKLVDLRESGSIEQDADVVMLPWRPEKDNPSKVLLYVAKHRNGETKELPLNWIAEQTKFEDWKPTFGEYGLPEGDVAFD